MQTNLRDSFDSFSGKTKILMAPHLNLASSAQEAEYAGATTAATNSWAEAESATGSYYVINGGNVAVEYLVNGSLPGSTTPGTFVAPGENSALVAVDGSSNLYVRTTRANDTADVYTLTEDEAPLIRQQKSLANMKAAFEPFWCDWQPVLQAEEPDDADYLTLREKFQTPPHLLLDANPADVHVNWIDASDDPGGYWFIGKAIIHKMIGMGIL